MINILGREQFYNQFDPSVHDKIKQMEELDGVTHLICLTVADFCSSSFGEMTAIVVGPGRTYKFADVEKPGFHLGDLPSRRMYPDNAMEIKKDWDYLSKEWKKVEEDCDCMPIEEDQ